MAEGELAILVATALVTAVLSAVAGLGGGITLLAVMLLFLPPLVAIPLHGVVQLFSNSSRVWFQRSHVDWPIVARCAIPLLPMGILGLAFARALPEGAVRLAIGVFVLVVTWRPGWLLLGIHPERTDRGRRFVVLGAVVGFLNMTVGATGPLSAPFFANAGLGRQGVIGTMAACQFFGHLAKITIFGFAGFAFAAYAGPIVLLSAAVVAGSWIGSRLLAQLSEQHFRWLLRAVLTLVALRLVGVEAAGLFGAGG